MKTFFTALIFATATVSASAQPLPLREGLRPETTPGVPHVQIGVSVVPEVQDELLRRVALLPGLEVRPTIVSLPGALGFWLTDDLKLAHAEVIVRGREFAHVHPDGSLHASLEPARAFESVEAGWAVRHPWADDREGWEGFVMLYTPADMDELEVTFGLIVDGYNFVTGMDLKPEDFR